MPLLFLFVSIFHLSRAQRNLHLRIHSNKIVVPGTFDFNWHVSFVEMVPRTRDVQHVFCGGTLVTPMQVSTPKSNQKLTNISLYFLCHL